VNRQARAPARVSRRRVLASGLTLATAAGLAARDTPAGGSASGVAADRSAAVVPFYGPHQAGIATPAQDRLAFAALDVTGTRAGDLRELLKAWTLASAAMARGQPVPGLADNDLAPPPDTGEAAGLGPANLSITFGFGPSLFDDRLGLTAHRPAALIDIPQAAR
jgi:deferrochelatase/peroxidase EfeB